MRDEGRERRWALHTLLVSRAAHAIQREQGDSRESTEREVTGLESTPNSGERTRQAK